MVSGSALSCFMSFFCCVAFSSLFDMAAWSRIRLFTRASCALRHTSASKAFCSLLSKSFIDRSFVGSRRA